jgi:hypothetical protein
LALFVKRRAPQLESPLKNTKKNTVKSQLARRIRIKSGVRAGGLNTGNHNRALRA